MKTPLRGKRPTAVSVCGKMLQRGQHITVPESAIGPRELRMEQVGKIRIRSSTQKGMKKITCTIR